MYAVPYRLCARTVPPHHVCVGCVWGGTSGCRRRHETGGTVCLQSQTDGRRRTMRCFFDQLRTPKWCTAGCSCTASSCPAAAPIGYHGVESGVADGVYFHPNITPTIKTPIEPTCTLAMVAACQTSCRSGWTLRGDQCRDLSLTTPAPRLTQAYPRIVVQV